MELSLDRCTIRSWRDGDEESLVRHANDREVWRNLRDRFPHPYTPADARAWLQSAGTHRPEAHFAIDVAGEAVGGIGLTVSEDIFRCSAEVGYWLGRPYWGRGVATEALRALTGYAFAHFDLSRLFAGILAWNTASARVLEKAGYALESRLRRAAIKDGQIVDVLLYGFVRDEGDSR